MDRSKGEQAVTTARQEGLRYYAYYWIASSSQPSSFCTSFCSPSCSFFILFLFFFYSFFILFLFFFYSFFILFLFFFYSFFILFLFFFGVFFCMAGNQSTFEGLSTLIPMPKHDRAYLFTSESCSNAGIFCRMRLLFETRMNVFAEPWRFRAPATCPLIRTLDINPKKTSREAGLTLMLGVSLRQKGCRRCFQCRNMTEVIFLSQKRAIGLV
jgi:hypothetical protein